MAEQLAVESAPAFLAQLQADGFQLWVETDNQLRVRPASRLTADLRAQLQTLKPALVALLEPVTEYIPLRGGLAVPWPALRLALDLEQRGFVMRVVTDGQVQVTPADALTLQDRAALHRWQRHVAAVVIYEPPEQ